jgi:allantoinase
MSDFDLIIRAGMDIGISDGKFAAIEENLRGSAAEEFDATGLVVLPGAIDAHVHFNEPGRTDWEGFATGSRAAACGGTTTVFEMPLNAHPPTLDGPSFDLKLEGAARKNSVVDFGLWGGLVPGNLDQLKTLKERGVVGLKAFMCNSGISDFSSVDVSTLREGMRIAADLDMLVAVHAESEEMTKRLTGEALAAGRETIADYLTSRPIAAELEAISQAIDLAAETGCRLHIVHVSNGTGVEAIADAHSKGVDVTCETCPHYLVLTESDLAEIGAVAKCAPPLRSRDEQERLWKNLGAVTTIGSDHSPSPPEMKQRSNFFEVWGGISGCQHLLPLLFDAAQDRSLSNDRIAALTSRNVAERFRIREKGGIEIGKDADLAFVNPNEAEEIRIETLEYRHRQTPYLERKLRGRLTRTILRGQTIFDRGRIVNQSPAQFVRPAYT